MAGTGVESGKQKIMQGAKRALVHVKPSGFANWGLSKLVFYPPTEAGRLGPVSRCSLGQSVLSAAFNSSEST